MGDEQRISWQELLAQSRDDFEAGTVHRANETKSNSTKGHVRASRPATRRQSLAWRLTASQNAPQPTVCSFA